MVLAISVIFCVQARSDETAIDREDGITGKSSVICGIFFQIWLIEWVHFVTKQTEQLLLIDLDIMSILLETLIAFVPHASRN